MPWAFPAIIPPLHHGWNGERWGYPDVSSVQDWDRGPVQRPIGDAPPPPG